MTAWEPGDAWPGTGGGASRPAWSPYVRFYLQTAIGAGNPFTLGPDPHDRLDDGNVIAFPGMEPGGDLWVDLACDAVSVEIHAGSSAAAGILSKADAGTLTVTVYDPTQRYDPLNPDTIYAIGGRSRLTPGAPVECWCEIVDPATATITTTWLFTGTVDRWGENWTNEPSDRRAVMVASDATKLFTRMNHPEQAPVGAHDTVADRLARIVAEFDWTGTIVDPATTPAATDLQATTLAQSAWELLNRAIQDELGFLYVDPEGNLRWYARADWTAPRPPSFTLACPDDVAGAHDIVTDATPVAFDTQLRNAAYAANTGGATQTATQPVSIGRWGEQAVNRTDLGMFNDTDAADWAQTIVNLYAFPQTSLDRIVLQPAVADQPWRAWRDVLGAGLIEPVIRVVWSPSFTIDVQVRPVGYAYHVNPDRFEVEWFLAQGTFTSPTDTFHIGDHPLDELDAGHVMAG